MSWTKIGYVTSMPHTDNYKKFQPDKIRAPSKAKRMDSIQRSKSFEKIKMSIEGRASSKNSSVNHIEISYQRPSTPLSKSSTSIHLMPNFGAINFYTTDTARRMKRIKKKLELYVKDLKQEMRILKNQLWIKQQEFFQFRIQIESNLIKVIDSFNRRINQTSQKLNQARHKVSMLTLENKQLKQKLQKHNQNRVMVTSHTTPYLEKKSNNSSLIESTVSTPEQQTRNKRFCFQSLSGYKAKGFNEIQNTINQLKQIFVDPFQI